MVSARPPETRTNYAVVVVVVVVDLQSSSVMREQPQP